MDSIKDKIDKMSKMADAILEKQTALLVEIKRLNNENTNLKIEQKQLFLFVEKIAMQIRAEDWTTEFREMFNAEMSIFERNISLT